jgi:hypothetical protein
MDLADRTVEALTADIVKYAIAGLGGTAGVMGGVSAAQNPVKAWRQSAKPVDMPPAADPYGVQANASAAAAVDYENRG